MPLFAIKGKEKLIGGLQWSMMMYLFVHHREPLCTIVKFLNHLANLHRYKIGGFRSLVHER